MQLRYHRLGTDPADDPVVFATPDQPEWGYEPEVTDDGRLLVLSVWRGTDPTNRVYVADLTDGVEAASVRPLLDAADARYELIDGVNGTLYLLTDLDAPRGRVVAIDVADPGELREVIPEGLRRPRDRPSRRRAAGGRLPPRCSPSAHDLRDRWAPRRRRRAAGHRHHRRAGRPTRRRGALPDVHDVRRSRRRPRRFDGGRLGARGGAAGAAMGPGRLRHRAGVRHFR